MIRCFKSLKICNFKSIINYAT